MGWTSTRQTLAARCCQLRPDNSRCIALQWACRSIATRASLTGAAPLAREYALDLGVPGQQDGGYQHPAAAWGKHRDSLPEGHAPFFFVVNKKMSAATACPSSRRPRAAGWTPLHISARENQSESVALLLKAGADARSLTEARPPWALRDRPGRPRRPPTRPPAGTQPLSAGRRKGSRRSTWPPARQ